MGRIVKVGDEVLGNEIRRIVVTPLPKTDPAGETSGVEVESIELGACPCVLDLSSGGWIYGTEAGE